MQIVPQKTDAYPKAAGQALFRIRLTVAILVLQQPQVGNVGEPHLAIAREHAGGQAVHLVIESIGKHRRVIHHAVTIAINQLPDTIGIIRQTGHLVAAKHRTHILGALRGELFVQPVHVTADIHHALMQAETFHDIKAALLVDIKRHRISQQRFGGHQAELQPRRHLEAFHGNGALVGGRLHLRALGRLQIRGHHRSGHEHAEYRKQSLHQ